MFLHRHRHEAGNLPSRLRPHRPVLARAVRNFLKNVPFPSLSVGPLCHPWGMPKRPTQRHAKKSMPMEREKGTFYFFEDGDTCWGESEQVSV
jgi:hypothetical protein